MNICAVEQPRMPRYQYHGIDAHEVEAPLRLVYTGSLTRNKGVYELLRGLEMAIADGIQAHLVVAGSGPEFSSLQRFARALDIEREVSFAGPVFGACKMEILRNTDVMLLPADAQGLPDALIEGMALGIPVIGSRASVIKDIVIEGVHGLFVRRVDPQGIAWAIAKLATDRELLARMSDECRQHVVVRCYKRRIDDAAWAENAYPRVCSMDDWDMPTVHGTGDINTAVIERHPHLRLVELVAWQSATV